ncbi:MAG: MaoC family dehydratase N-terminal domain-containing protein [Candidatus Brocadiia bacterium]|jgi:acyl dehydratase|nr:MaoC family dehydratase N-terminal domain-containing protein [Candidatus Brocadiia bacterium]
MTEEAPSFDRSILGKEFPSGRLDVTEDLARRYRRAIGQSVSEETDAEEARREGIRGARVPATVVNLMIHNLDRPDVEAALAGGGLHGSQSLEIIAPICVGDTLDVRSVLEDVYTKTGRSGTMTFVVWENRFVNQDGETVVRMRESFMYR